jgi:RND family efflux transporter MFP subunit
MALYLSLFTVVGCGGEPGALPERTEPAEVSVSSPVATSAFVTVPGTVVSAQRAELATRASGTIRRIPVDIGTRVARGEALVELNTDDIEARVTGAQASARLARQYHDRIAALVQDGAATEQELDEARARLEMAEAGLREARAQREYVVLRAPFAGVVSARWADPGDLAKPGVPVLELIGSSALKIEADLPADMAGRLSEGHGVSVYLPGSGQRFPARVTRVVPAVETKSRRFKMEARFETDSAAQPSIPPGTFARIELDQPTATTRWIPDDALVVQGQLKGVFSVEDDRLRLRWIRTGQRLGETVEMLAGPGSDALIVRRPAPGLRDGQAVSAVERIEWSPQALEGRTAMRKEEGR